MRLPRGGPSHLSDQKKYGRFREAKRNTRGSSDAHGPHPTLVGNRFVFFFRPEFNPLWHFYPCHPMPSHALVSIRFFQDTCCFSGEDFNDFASAVAGSAVGERCEEFNFQALRRWADAVSTSPPLMLLWRSCAYVPCFLQFMHFNKDDPASPSGVGFDQLVSSSKNQSKTVAHCKLAFVGPLLPNLIPWID